ncbi:Melanin-concentrating hormone receptor 2 [Dirofilaria immitis]|nr:Melanin-concentrating hormone receptor 2 [Dirofilaria immitis]
MEYVLQESTVANTVRNHAGSFMSEKGTDLFTWLNLGLEQNAVTDKFFILFCNFTVLNIFDALSGMFIPLLFIINNNWLFDMTLCRLNATLEQFINMELLMGLMIMAIERSIILYFPNQIIFRNCQTLAYVVVLWIIGICLAIPVLTHSIPVKPNEFRYNCDIDSGLPISYPIACILIYSSCLIIILICFAALLSRNNQRRDQSLPMKSQENSVFVRQTLNHDYQSFSKLILLLIILFILFDGPYIILNILMQDTTRCKYNPELVTLDVSTNSTKSGCLRPCYTTSRPICQAKQRCALISTGSEMAWEHQVL